MGAKQVRLIAQEVLHQLDSVERELKKARNWGLYDMLGGGFFASWIKFGKVDKAEKQLNEVQLKLEKLQTELGDLQLEVDHKLDISGFHRFMDIAFDHIIVDWLSQTKIVDSLKDVSRLKLEIRNIISTLDRIDQG